MTRYCPECGTKSANAYAKYCYNCGKPTSGENQQAASTCSQASASSSSSSKTISTPVSTLSYDEFRKRKQLSRTKKIQSGKKPKTDEEVKVQVGLVEADGGKLKKLKGRTLPLVVSSSCNADNLLKAATEKHTKHFKQFNKHANYMLLYADYSIVQKLPGSLENFVLNTYKKDLGKAYSKIYFYLCDIVDFERVKDFNEDSESDDEISIYRGKERKDASKVENAIKISDDEFTKQPPPETSCPTCFRMFPLHEIEAHANMCADWIDPIGDVPDDVLEELFKENDFLDTYADEDDTQIVSPDDQFQKMKDLVAELAKNVQPVKIRINVRRKLVFKDYLDIAKKPWFNSGRMLKVTFVGEPAIDDGGPRREFFSEVLQSIQHELFESGMPLPDMAALGNNKFKTAGELMAASIVQGGPAPCFLSEEAYAYVVEGISSVTTEGWLSQLKNKKIVDTIEKIKQCTIDKSLQDLLVEEDVMDVLQLVHYRGVPLRESLQSVNNILRSLVMYDFSIYFPMLDQLITGLSSFGMIDAMRENKRAMEPLFIEKHSQYFIPSADQLLDGIKAEFSDEGSNRKDKEIDIHKFFCDFLQDAEALKGIDAVNTLSVLHKFITGCEQIPPLGLPESITVKFKHGCMERCKCRPTASTCDLSITLPVHYHDDYNQFKEVIDSALIEGKGFGLI